MAALRHHGLRPDCGSKNTALSIVYRNIDELKLDPRNPRRHSKKQVQQIARSIEAFGFNVPCIVDERHWVISGHGRLAAAQLMGIWQVPTISIAHLNANQIRAFQIADNRLTENSTWNRTVLAEELQSLRNVNLDFDLESTGFEIGEINLFIEGLESVPTQDMGLVEGLTRTESEIAVSQPGDLWVLSNHRLVCDSGCHKEGYAVLMNGRRAAAVFIHLPADRAEDAQLLLELFSELAEHSDPGALQFAVTDQRFVKTLAGAERAGLRLIDVCVAIKKNAEPGRLYQRQHDLIFVLENGKAEPSSQRQFNRTNVWFYPDARSRRHRSELRKAELIQNNLPAALVADAIEDVTERGGIVLDPFLGTGTTLMAAEQTDRICYALESDPLQLDRVVRRWQELTGLAALNEQRGKAFDQIVQEDRNGKK